MWTNWLDPALLNTVHCMDCLEFMKWLPDKCIDLVLTDPPYNINLKPQRWNTDSIANDNMSKDDFILFLDSYFFQCKRILKNDTFLITFLGWPTIPEFRFVCDKYFDLKSMPIWVKNNFWIWYYTRPKYEPCLLYLNGKPPILENPPSDVWEHDKIQAPIHSCEKPVQLYRFILENFSQEWDTVFDWFAWVWALWVACKELWRNYILCEREPKYVDIIHKRLQNTTVSLFHS